MKIAGPSIGASSTAKSPAAQKNANAGLESWLVELDKELAAQPPPALGSKSEQVDLAYRQYCKKVNAGENIDPAEYCLEHSQIRNSLARVIQAHHFAEGQLEPNWPKLGQHYFGFELIRELGRGGFARVFLAKEPALGDRYVAIKVSEKWGAEEASTLGRINHPNIVPVYSIKHDEANHLTLVCMPYLGSTTLCDWLDGITASVPSWGEGHSEVQHGEAPLSNGRPGKDISDVGYIDEVRAIGAQLADALQFIHDREICHRDLKPSNVLMTSHSRPMLLDFNLSADAKLNDLRIGGTLPYMSPEQVLAMNAGEAGNASVIGPSSDLFSLGVILYEMLAGAHPFGALPLKVPLPQLRAIVTNRQQRGVLALRTLNPSIDPKFARLVESCLSYNPAQRPANAAQVASALRRQMSPLQRFRRWAGHRPWHVAAAVLMMLVFAGVASAWWSMQESEDSRHWRNGQTAHANRDFSKAVDHYDAVLQTTPDNPEALLARSKAYIKLGESDARYLSQAFNDLRRLETLQPTGEVYAGLGFCLLRLESSTALARQHFSAAVERGFAPAEVHNNLAYCLQKLAKYTEAEKHLNAALELQPNLQAALHNRGFLRVQQVLQAGGLNPPTRQKTVQPLAIQTESKCLDWLRQGKDDYSAALRCEPISMELLADAARFWGFSSKYTPTDAEQSLTYLETAVAHGYDAKSAPKDPGFEALWNDPRFQTLCQRVPQVRTAAPTLRVVNPLER